MTAQIRLLFDIGNTTIKTGLADPERLLASYTLPARHAETGDSLGLKLAEICRHAGVSPDAVTGCLACSVAPALDGVLAQACARFFGQQLRFAPVDVPIPLDNRYGRPQEVGADRLVAAYAARRLHEAPSLVVVDYGTATTFECVQENAYLGGLICPGLLSSAAALATRTAKLPQVRLDFPGEELQIGRSTGESLEQGLLFGFAAMAEGLVRQLKSLLQARAAANGIAPGITVVATGGLVAPISRLCACFDSIRGDLLLEGLRLLYAESGLP